MTAQLQAQQIDQLAHDIQILLLERAAAQVDDHMATHLVFPNQLAINTRQSGTDTGGGIERFVKSVHAGEILIQDLPLPFRFDAAAPNAVVQFLHARTVSGPDRTDPEPLIRQ